MFIETRLRKLEEHLAVRLDAKERDRVRAETRRLMDATVNDPAADEALREKAEAQVEYGHQDPRTHALITRHWPLISAALERYDRTHAA